MKKIFNILAAAAAMFAAVSCVEDKQYEGPSTISSVTVDIEAPNSNQAVTVTAVVEGLQAVKTATLDFTVNGTKNNVAMTGSGTKYVGVIPAQADKAKVEYTVTVVNSAGFTTVSSPKSYTVGNPPTDFTKLKLNEVYGAGSDEEKFFELYNESDFPINLQGVTINKDEELSWTGIAGESVPAHGWFAIVGAKNTTDRGFSSGFSAKKSVLVELFDPNGKKLDTFQRGEKGEGWGSLALSNVKGSWSRVPDGSGKWVITNTFTPNAKNADKDADADDIIQ